MHVPDESRAALAECVDSPPRFVAEERAPLRLVGQTVHADINDGRAGFDVLAAYEARAPYGRAEYVGLARDRGGRARARVADCDGRVALQEECRDGAADDVAAADDDRARAAHLHALAPEHLDNSRGRTWQKRGPSQHHAPDVDGREAVHVLVRVDGLYHRRLVEAARQRKLDEYAVNVVARVERLDHLDEARGLGRDFELMVFGDYSQLAARANLVSNVDGRGGVFAHEHGHEARREAVLCRESRDLFRDLALYLRGHARAVEFARPLLGLCSCCRSFHRRFGPHPNTVSRGGWAAPTARRAGARAR